MVINCCYLSALGVFLKTVVRRPPAPPSPSLRPCGQRSRWTASNTSGRRRPLLPSPYRGSWIPTGRRWPPPWGRPGPLPSTAFLWVPPNSGERSLFIFADFSHCYTDKREIKFSSYIRKFRMEQLQSHIWLTASSCKGKYLSFSSYIRKPFLIYCFATAPFWIAYIWGKFYFLFYQCIVSCFWWLLYTAVYDFVLN